MATSNAFPSSLFAPTIQTPSLLRPRKVISLFVSPLSASPSRYRFRRSCSVNVAASAVAERGNGNDDYGGWDLVESPPVVKDKKGLSKVVIAGAGTSVAVLLAAAVHFSFSRKCFRLPLVSPLNALHGMLSSSGIEECKGTIVDSDASEEAVTVFEEIPANVSSALEENPAPMEKVERVIIPVATDPTQQEAISVLKKLKVVEDDIKADELCTRRDFARWLVRANSFLERNPKYKFCPPALLSGSTTTAFDDIGVQDPDFGSIQALAEAGIIVSKLAGKSLSSDLDSESQQGVYFFPERFISRHDLIDWKAQLNYKLTPLPEEKTYQTKAPFIDVREISSDASPGFLLDVLAGEKSILRKVFGQMKRFQPNKPCTKAQAAVALTSGRMTKAIQAELARIEAESISRQVEMEEIKTELLEIGDIKNFWDQKLNEEKARAFDVDKAYLAALHDLEQGKIAREKSLVMFSKEKAAMDCQKQLIFNLKKEVSEMSERLEKETTSYLVEQHDVKDTLNDLQTKYEGLLDAKSILEAEKEAIQILRSWIEEEARKSQARAKVLEEATRRWRWESEA